MRRLIRKLESKILTKLFTRWVDTEWDTELLALTRGMINKQELLINQMIGMAKRTEVKGYRIGS